MAIITLCNCDFCLVREMGQSDKELVCNELLILWQILMTAMKARTSSNTFPSTAIYGRRGEKKSLNEIILT